MSVEYRIIDGAFVKGWINAKGRWVRAPKGKLKTPEHYLGGGPVAKAIGKGRGEHKYRTPRDRIEHLFEQAWSSANYSEAALKKDAKNAHYFPKSPQEYAAMAGFDGRLANNSK